MGELLQHPVIAVVFLIGILVFVHEFGHFIVGKLFGFGVETFSIGFGPRIFGFRKSGTDYRISIIPLGGYVKFAGSVPSEPVPDRFAGMEMYKKPVWQRALMTFAGPFANLLLAIVAYTYLGSVGIKHESPVVGQVRSASVASEAGLQPGDKITQIGGQDIQKWSELVGLISAAGGEQTKIVWDRNGEKISASLTPEYEEVEDINGNKKKVGRIGISQGFLPSKVAVLNDSLAQSLTLVTGDEITAVDGEEVSTYHVLVASLGKAYLSGKREVELDIKTSLGPKRDPLFSKKVVSIGNISIPSNVNDPYQVGSKVFERLGLENTSLTIAKLSDGFEDSGLMSGDFLHKVDGKVITDIFDLQYFLVENKSGNVNVTVIRGGKEIDIDLKLREVEVQKAKGKDIFYAFPGQFMGERISPEPFVEKYDSIFGSMIYGTKRALVMSAQIVGALAGLITGDVPLGALGGPMLIAKVAGDSAALGLVAYLSTLAVISINLCMINLFPIPVLDGGQLVMLGAEAIKGRALSEQAIENYQKVGFVMVMGLVLLSTYNDLGRFWASMLRTVGGQ